MIKVHKVWRGTLKMNLGFSKDRDKQVCAGLELSMYNVYIMFLKLHHSGTQFFRGNVDWFFDPEIRQLHSPGG